MPRTSSRDCRRGFQIVVKALAAGLLLGLAVSWPARAADAPAATPPPEKPAVELIHVPTGPLHPTTEQLIPEEAAAGHRLEKMVLLHVNDVHEILKPPARGLGGLAYVAGYARQVREACPETLLIDAGDILEKGDRMSAVSQGEASYRVLGAIGLDCTVPGNHDFVFGLDRLRTNVSLVQLPILCTGLVYNDTQESVFPETMVKQVGGLKVGLIGATIGRPVRSSRPVTLATNAELGVRVNALAEQLNPTVDLTVLVLHNGTWAAKVMAKAAPAVDVVVCGHTNEVTEAPMKADTGALVVTVGRAGQWVGRLDLRVDCDQKRVARYTYEMIPMDHAKITPEPTVARLIDELDRKWCPEAYAPQPVPQAP